MRILLNGDSHELAPEATISQLKDSLPLSGRRVAVEVNGRVVPASEHASRTLEEGDRVELITAIGGG